MSRLWTRVDFFLRTDKLATGPGEASLPRSRGQFICALWFVTNISILMQDSGHYYLSMRDHPMFKEIFKDDGALAEEFAKLFAKQWEPPQNLVYLPQESNWMSDDVVEWVPLWAVEA